MDGIKNFAVPASWDFDHHGGQGGHEGKSCRRIRSPLLFEGPLIEFWQCSRFLWNRMDYGNRCSRSFSAMLEIDKLLPKWLPCPLMTCWVLLTWFIRLKWRQDCSWDAKKCDACGIHRSRFLMNFLRAAPANRQFIPYRCRWGRNCYTCYRHICNLITGLTFTRKVYWSVAFTVLSVKDETFLPTSASKLNSPLFTERSIVKPSSAKYLSFQPF